MHVVEGKTIYRQAADVSQGVLHVYALVFVCESAVKVAQRWRQMLTD